MRILLLGFCMGLAGCAQAPSGAPKAAPTLVAVSRPVQRDVTDHADFAGGTAAVDSVEARARVWGSAMTESRILVVHVRMTADRPFASVQAAFERRLGRFEP